VLWQNSPDSRMCVRDNNTKSLNYVEHFLWRPIPMAERSKAHMVEHCDRGFGFHSKYGVTFAFFCVVLPCVSTSLAMDRSPVQGTLPQYLWLTVSEIPSVSEQARGPNWFVQPRTFVRYCWYLNNFFFGGGGLSRCKHTKGEFCLLPSVTA